MNITDNELDILRKDIKSRLTEKRYMHTLSVEGCAQELSSLIIPENKNEARAAALLHDITKELGADEHISLIGEVDATDLASPQILHSFSAEKVILRDFPRFATEKILSAVRKHTVGDYDMSLLDLIIFVSDYCEPLRVAPPCREVYDFLFSGMQSLDFKGRVKRLYEACLIAVLKTKEFLEAKGAFVNPKTLECEKFLKEQILQM